MKFATVVLFVTTAGLLIASAKQPDGSWAQFGLGLLVIFGIVGLYGMEHRLKSRPRS